jgi:hypothetical protein
MSKASAITCALSLWVSMMLVHDALSQRSQGDDNLPTLYGAILHGSQINIDVASFGCTDASYFHVQLDPASTDVFRLSIIAQKQDMCRMSAHIITLTLDIPAVANLAEARFLVMNRFAAPATLRRPAPQVPNPSK